MAWNGYLEHVTAVPKKKTVKIVPESIRHPAGVEINSVPLRCNDFRQVKKKTAQKQPGEDDGRFRSEE